MADERKQIIAAHWADFDQKVIPKDAPDIQRLELQKAFYSGAAIMLGAIHRTIEACDNGFLSQEAAALIVDGLEEEIVAFASSLNPNNDTTTRFEWKHNPTSTH